MSLNPFLPSSHGHPNFNPTKSVMKNFQLETSRNSKQPKPPDKPLMPYMRYSKKVWDEVRAQFPDLKVWEISKIVGQMWRDLDDNEKQKYIEEFESEKNEYNELLKQYHNSAAYQSWISSLKMKENEDKDNPKRREKKINNHNIHNSPQKSEVRFSLQLMESDENEEYFSAKHLAAARYYRNNKLVNDIFNDSIVPDIRNTSNVKVQLLRKQVDSLRLYQKKLDEELKQIEETFQQKKHALLESSERFHNEMNKRFAPNDLDITLKEHYQKTLIKTMESMKGEQEFKGYDNKIGHSFNETNNLGPNCQENYNGIDKLNENSDLSTSQSSLTTPPPPPTSITKKIT